MTRYVKPASLEEAIALLAEGGWTVLAGGTDFYPSLGSDPPRTDILDVNALAELRAITETQDGIAIGARTTWSDIVRAKLPPSFHALQQAAREVGSVQIQNVATVAGNLCNASPAADGVPPLMVLDAEIELRSLAGCRRLPLAEFLLANRRTARRSEELMVAVHVPRSALGGCSAFSKLGARRYLVISIAMCAVRLSVDEAGRLTECAVAVGSCSPVARRQPALEASLVGRSREAAADFCRGATFEGLAPIDDVRASASYRLAATAEIVARAVDDAFVQLAGERQVAA